jgi:TolB protein
MRHAWIIHILLLTALSANSQDVFLKIQSGEFEPVTLAVPPWSSNDLGQSEIVRKVLIDDLKASPFFRVLADVPVDSIPQPGSVLCDVRTSVSPTRFVAEARISDLLTGRPIFNKKLTTELSSTRWIGHRLADALMEGLIGEPGAACTRIAFVARRNRAKDIWVMDWDGQGLRRIILNDSLNLSPAWSPDGNRLAFVSFVLGKPSLFIYDLNRNRIIPLYSGGSVSAPAWSPDGNKIAFTFVSEGNADIAVVDDNGKQFEKMTNLPTIECAPAWSPDGSRIAFTSDRSGSPQVYVMDASGGDIRRLTMEGSYNDSPAWSPKGDRIAYVTREASGFQIMVSDVLGDFPVRVTDQGSNEDPTWSPDGLWIAFASNRDGEWGLFRIHPDGSGLTRIGSIGGATSPAWSPRIKE